MSAHAGPAMSSVALSDGKAGSTVALPTSRLRIGTVRHLLLLLLVLLLPALPGAAASLGPPPHRLVGTYAATIPNLPAIGVYAGRYKLTLGPGSKITYDLPGEGRISQGASFSGSRVTFLLGYCVTRGVYVWKLRGKILTFKKVRDSCQARAAILQRRWTRLS